MTKQVICGGLPIGGGAPVSVQSMTNTKTEQIEPTVRQIKALAAVGCDIVRVAVPNMEAAKAIGKIKEQVSLPVVADIHFDYRLALEAVAAGADKIRINPGNIGGDERVKAVADACRSNNVPIRIGVNGGSLEKEILAEYGAVTPEAMVASAEYHIELLNHFDFDDICVSLKSSNTVTTVQAYRLMAEKWNYPLHLGVTEAGTQYMGIIKSAIGIGGLLLDGIGDTIRVSLTADPTEEVLAGESILRALGERKAPVELISCPSCGRCDVALIDLANDVQKALAGYSGRPITVAVMGCVVNGPGEASQADYGIAGGKDSGVVFKHGEIVKKVPADKLASELIRMIKEEERQ